MQAGCFRVPVYSPGSLTSLPRYTHFLVREMCCSYFISWWESGALETWRKGHWRYWPQQIKLNPLTKLSGAFSWAKIPVQGRVCPNFLWYKWRYKNCRFLGPLQLGCLVGIFFSIIKLTCKKGKNISLILWHFAPSSGELKGSGELWWKAVENPNSLWQDVHVKFREC